MRTTLDGSRATADTGRLVSVSSAISPISAPRPTTVGGRAVLLRHEVERAFLHHIGAVRILALAEQRVALVDVAASPSRSR